MFSVRSWLYGLHKRHTRVLVLFLGACFLFLSVGVGNAAPDRQTPVPPDPPPPLGPIRLTDPIPDPKQQDVLYFPATGHTLRGVFKDYWQRYGGLAQFGYPLTEEFFEPGALDGSSLQVQYFERNRFELHPENAGTPYEVLLSVLGRDFRSADPAVAQQPGPGLYFPETGHNLSGEFQEYWETHGGLFVHGYPVTEPAMERSSDGKEYLVQWFERSRFELHPENAGSQYEVLLGLLGVRLVQDKGYFDGTYPRYGHAADFAWIAGRITEYGFIGFTPPNAGCTIIQYEEIGTRFQLNNSNNNHLSLTSWQQLNSIVVFGRPHRPDEPKSICSIDPEAPIYVVAQPLQFNKIP